MGKLPPSVCRHGGKREREREREREISRVCPSWGEGFAAHQRFVHGSPTHLHLLDVGGILGLLSPVLGGLGHLLLFDEVQRHGRVRGLVQDLRERVCAVVGTRVRREIRSLKWCVLCFLSQQRPRRPEY